MLDDVNSQLYQDLIMTGGFGNTNSPNAPYLFTDSQITKMIQGTAVFEPTTIVTDDGVGMTSAPAISRVLPDPMPSINPSKQAPATNMWEGFTNLFKDFGAVTKNTLSNPPTIGTLPIFSGTTLLLVVLMMTMGRERRY